MTVTTNLGTVVQSRGSERGQALVELALVLPLLVAFAGLILIGGQLMAVEVRLTDAARAGAVAAAAAADHGGSPQTAAAEAASAEGGPLSCRGAGLPASCVSLSSASGAPSGVQMEVVTVYDTAVPWWPGPPITVQARAAAAR